LRGLPVRGCLSGTAMGALAGRRLACFGRYQSGGRLNPMATSPRQPLLPGVAAAAFPALVGRATAATARLAGEWLVGDVGRLNWEHVTHAGREKRAKHHVCQAAPAGRVRTANRTPQSRYEP
jgi:hypothetical protein